MATLNFTVSALPTAAQELLGDLKLPNQPALYGSAIAIAFASFLTYLFWPSALQGRTQIHQLGGLSILTAWPFFTGRFDFIWKYFKQTGLRAFQFRILHVRTSDTRSIRFTR